MTQGSLAALARFCFVFLFCYTLALTTASCVRLPRRVHPASDQIASSVMQGTVRELPRININSASPAELEKLPGIGQTLAEQIVEHRERYGPFRRIEHLLMLRGISDRRLREMRAFITAERP